ncbi:hypothetical protein ABEB36_012609 [Hypothenemus hampei]|uniref:Thyroglobulin type-1 domain-containing protein n=1 Tax=Hypothenemus hampei TaxID=57062 RepID=A0ABD1EBZ1_HYPHA
MIDLIVQILLVILLCVVATLQISCPATLVTSLHQKNCTDMATSETAYYLNRTLCIPKCDIYPKEVTTGDCSTDPDGCIAGYICAQRCGPASSLNVYSCSVDLDCYDYNPRAKCGRYCVLPEIDDNAVTCMAYHSNIVAYIDKWWTAKKFKPVCDDYGDWEPKQCKGGIAGRCFCYSTTGIRLFGQALYSESVNMTCACSRKISDLTASGRTYISLHCDSKGNYETLQCDTEKNFCWCVEYLTGSLTAPVVPLSAMNKLPCYTEAKVGSQYLRQCESKKFATAMITKKLKYHGVVSVAPDTLLCDADGSYGAYMVDSGIAYCTWRDNTKIQAWQANIGTMTEKLNCNCARDYHLYGSGLSCDSTGNYLKLQQIIENDGNKYFCVDDDGFTKTDMLDDPLTNCSRFY